MRGSAKAQIAVGHKIKGQVAPGDRAYAINLVTTVCALAGSLNYLADLRVAAQRNGLIRAVRTHDTPALFEWFVSMASFQGISNSVAAGYIKQNGSAHWNDLQIALDAKPSCPKLASYWQFYGCHYAKGSCTCAEPAHLENCPLPALPLRNGSLNKLAYSLFLCIRDLAGDDFVAWIDNQLAIADESPTANRLATMAEAVIGPLRNIHGLSDKVLNMTLATLLLGAGRGKARWVEIGASLICHRYTCA